MGEKIRADAAAKRGNGRRRLPNVPDALTRGPLPGADGARRKQYLHNSYADHIQARRQAERAAELEKIRADAAAKRGNGRRRLPNVPDALTRGPLPGADGARRKQYL